MSKFYSPLSDIKVASPCSADWNETNTSTNTNAVMGKPSVMQGNFAINIPKTTETPKTKSEIGTMRVISGQNTGRKGS